MLRALSWRNAPRTLRGFRPTTSITGGVLSATGLWRGSWGAAKCSSLSFPCLTTLTPPVDGPFAAVAEKLEATLVKFGMERFGQVGDPFDPAVHEALMHQTSEEATGPSVSLVIQPGYRAGERILRPARVAVVDAA